MPAQSAREFVVLGGTKGDLQSDGKGPSSCCRPRGRTRTILIERKDPRVIAATIG